jgi:hypothetical protein
MESQAQIYNANLLLTQYWLKLEWNQMVWPVNNLRCGTAAVCPCKDWVVVILPANEFEQQFGHLVGHADLARIAGLGVFEENQTIDEVHLALAEPGEHAEIALVPGMLPST